MQSTWGFLKQILKSKLVCVCDSCIIDGDEKPLPRVDHRGTTDSIGKALERNISAVFAL